MNNDLSPVLFYLFAAIVIISALGMIYCHNLVHSALSLALSFMAVAGLYAMINADFIAAVQIMIYAGTVVILIVLGIMITRRTSIQRSNMPAKKYIFCASGLIVLLFATLSYIFTHITIASSEQQAPINDTVAALAELLLGHYMFAFEVAAVLLLAAMLGAVVLAKGADEE